MWNSADIQNKACYGDDKVENGATRTKDDLSPTKAAYQWGLVALLVFYMFLDGLQMTQHAAYIPNYFRQHGLSQAYVGACTAALYVGMVIGVAICPKMAHKFGNLTLIRSALVLSGGGHLVVAFVCPILTYENLFGLYFAMRFVLGLLEGILAIAVQATVIRVLPVSTAAFMIGVLEVSRTLAFLAAPLFGSELFLAGGSSLQLPYAVLGAALLGLVIVFNWLIIVSRQNLLNESADKEEPDARVLLKKPPVIAIIIVVFFNFIPVSAIEPALEPYLTAPPFNISVSQVGLTLLAISGSDVLGALIAVPLAVVIDHIPTLLLSAVLTITSTLLLAMGPQTWLAVTVSFIPQSFATISSAVIAPGILMRIAQSYGLDPKVYAETIMAIITGTSNIVVGIFSLISGIALDAIGFRHWFLVIGYIACISPIAILWGFHPAIMGVPLVKMDDRQKWDDRYGSQQENVTNRR